MRFNLLSLSNPKVNKGKAKGWWTAVLHLAPSTLSGINVCPWASKGCREACLAYSGNGMMFAAVNESRIMKTLAFHHTQRSFLARLVAEVGAFEAKARKAGFKPAVRLNATSDICWEDLVDFSAFPGIRFYDYTKSPARVIRSATDPTWPANYTLTLSRSECNEQACLSALAAGGNVAVVFDTAKKADLPTMWHGFTVIDGRTHDLRFQDPKGVVVGLSALGPAKHDASGFVVRRGLLAQV